VDENGYVVSSEKEEEVEYNKKFIFGQKCLG
jgi:hypothetical protein